MERSNWRLKHRLFGWHFVHLKNTATEIVRRVRETACGQRYVVYFDQHLIFIDKDDCGWTVNELTSMRPIWRQTAVSAGVMALSSPDGMARKPPLSPPPPPTTRC